MPAIAWFAPFMMKRTPRAIAQNLPITRRSPMNGEAIQHVALEILRIFRVVALRVFADEDVGIADGVGFGFASVRRRRMRPVKFSDANA